MFRTNFLTHHLRFAIILLLIIILGSGWLFFLGPRWEDLNTERAAFKNQQEIFISRENRLEKLEKITRDYEGIAEEKIKKIESVLPSVEDLPGIFVQMEALAKENEFILSSVEIKKEESGIRNLAFAEASAGEQVQRTPDSFGESRIKEIGITLKLENGSYERFKKFLSEVEKNLRILDVISVSFDSKGTSFGVELKTYYL